MRALLSGDLRRWAPQASPNLWTQIDAGCAQLQPQPIAQEFLAASARPGLARSFPAAFASFGRRAEADAGHRGRLTAACATRGENNNVCAR